MPTTYAFDHTGSLLANKITGEQQIITVASFRDYHYIVPVFAPFFANGLSISYRDLSNNVRTLIEGIDYNLSFQFVGASRACALPIYGGISFLDLTLSGVVTLVYQTLGGNWTIDTNQVNTILSDTLRNPRITTWEMVANVPGLFPVVDHEWNLTDLVGMISVVEKVDEVALAIANRPAAVIDISAVSKVTVGLSNVDNFSTASDAETISGTLATKFTTPHSVKAAIDAFLTGINNLYTTVASLIAPTGANLIGTAVGKQLDSAGITVKTMAELKALSAPDVTSEAATLVTVLGGLVEGDSLGNRFYWDRFSIEDDDGFSIIIPNSNQAQGRWFSLDNKNWLSYNFVATNGQQTFALTNTPYYNSVPIIIVNNTLQLSHRYDFNINGKTINFNYPFEADDTVSISIQTKAPESSVDYNWINQKFSVSSQGQVFTLSGTIKDPDYIKVILNNYIILNYSIDFSITGNNISINYPLEAGDEIEVISLNTISVNELNKMFNNIN